MNILRQLTAVSRFSTRQRQYGIETQGVGQVSVSTPDDNRVIFKEQGQRQSENGSNVDFTNAYGWEILPNGQLSLSHLRRGEDNAVHLVNLEKHGDTMWQTVELHHCGSDIYRATLVQKANEIHLHWDIHGAKKAIEIDVVYR